MFHHSGPNGNIYKKSSFELLRLRSRSHHDIYDTVAPWHCDTVTPWHRNVVTNLYTLYVSQCRDKHLYFMCFKGVSCVYTSQILVSSSLLSSLVFVYTFLCHLLTDFDDSTGCYSFEVHPSVVFWKILSRLHCLNRLHQWEGHDRHSLMGL